MRSARLLGLAMIGGLLLTMACGGGGGGSTAPGPTVQAPNALTYTNSTATYTNGIPITSNSPNSGGGVVTAYSVSPTLPVGLNLSTTTGIISGTPTVAAPVANFVVTASNSGGSTTAILNITVNDPATGSWAYTGSMVDVRMDHTATLLQNGKVLVAGGHTGRGDLASSETFDPTSGMWSATGNLVTRRSDHTATLLLNGKVLVVGGYSSDGVTGAFIGNAELYDPATGVWTATGGLLAARNNHQATMLSNGKVLVSGGGVGFGSMSSTEIYDPSTGAWTSSGNMGIGREGHRATLLSNGKVLVSGGYDGSTYTQSAEIYDPASGLWASTGSMGIGRGVHTSTMLPSGKVLVAAGYNSAGAFGTPLASAEIYDPQTGAWTSTGNLADTRWHHTATMLSNGKVIIIGGNSLNGSADVVRATAEIYDPLTGTWSFTSTMHEGRATHTATLLQNGKVVVAGDNGMSGLPSTAETL